MIKSIRGVLFDLDGTLLDTAPDLAYALNQLRNKHGMTALPLEIIRPIAGLGMRALLKLGFGIDEAHPDFAALREEYFFFYQKHLTDRTTLFPHMEEVLSRLDERQLPWGIVTNKHSRFALELLKAIQLHHRSACIVYGDTLATAKPHPGPILHGCELLSQPPNMCVYIGDTQIDVIAGKAAGTATLVALYGYITEEENPFAWQADAYIRHPLEILDWLEVMTSR